MEITKEMYWDLVKIINQWQSNGRCLNCKECKKAIEELKTDKDILD